MFRRSPGQNCYPWFQCGTPLGQRSRDIVIRSVGQLLQDDATSPPILAALESDGEPAYELLACPGYLWLSALLLGLLPSDSPQPDVASLPFWRARCAFVWQLSIADASERGCGQCPSLFKASIADLIGEAGDTTSPLSTAGLLDPRARVELQQATAPLLRSYKRGTMPVGTPQAGRANGVIFASNSGSDR